MRDDALRRERLARPLRLDREEEQRGRERAAERADGRAVRPRDVAAAVEPEQEEEDRADERACACEVDACEPVGSACNARLPGSACCFGGCIPDQSGSEFGVSRLFLKSA